MPFYILQALIFNKTIKYSFKKFLRDIIHNKKYFYSILLPHLFLITR